MASNTEHYNLVKPDYTDAADVAQLNGNMDIIDNLIWQLANAGGDEEILALLRQIIETIGETDDTGGSSTLGSAMAKLNALIEGNADIINYMPYLNSTVTGDNPVSLDILLTQLLYGTTFEYTTAGTYQLFIPANVHKIVVDACGAGGGGAYQFIDGKSTTHGNVGAGGGGDAIYQKEFTVTPQSTLSIIIGAAGAAGNRNGTTADPTPANGKNGGATIIGNLVTLAGGYGGRRGEISEQNLGGEPGGPGGAKGGTGVVTKEVGVKAEDGGNTSTAQGGIGATTSRTGGTRNCVAGSGGGASLGNGSNGRPGSQNTATKGGGGGASGYVPSDGSGMTYDALPGAPGYAKITLILDAA